MIKNKIVSKFIDRFRKIPLEGEDKPAFDALSNALGDAMGFYSTYNYPIYKARPNKAKLKHHLLDTTDIDSFFVDPTDPAKTSQLLGEASNLNKATLRPLHTAIDWVPVYSGIQDVYDTSKANSTSWDAIQKAYKDDPEILNLFSKLRNKSLTAEMKYKLSYTVPRAIIGSFLAYRWGKWAGKQFDKKKNPILHNIAKFSLGGLGAITGWGLGGLFHRYSGLSRYYRNDLKDIKKSEEYKRMSNELNAKILAHKNKSK